MKWLFFVFFGAFFRPEPFWECEFPGLCHFGKYQIQKMLRKYEKLRFHKMNFILAHITCIHDYRFNTVLKNTYFFCTKKLHNAGMDISDFEHFWRILGPFIVKWQWFSHFVAVLRRLVLGAQMELDNKF